MTQFRLKLSEGTIAKSGRTSSRKTIDCTEPRLWYLVISFSDTGDIREVCYICAGDEHGALREAVEIGAYTSTDPAAIIPVHVELPRENVRGVRLTAEDLVSLGLMESVKWLFKSYSI